MTRRDPLTRAEATDYRETSLHADVMAFLAALARRGDRRLHVGAFGKSPEGRELPLVIASGRGITTPEDAHASGLPVVLIINGIHAGEVEGKEASLMLLRDMLDGQDAELLDAMVLVVVPLFNPDGNDRIDPANRRLDVAKLQGQMGPDTGVGTRVTAAGINLNRDYLRQDAPEMRLLSARVYQAWQPHLTIDCHATNGSVHRFALTYDTPHTVHSGRIEPIAFMRETLLPEVRRRLRQRTGLETFFYGNFVSDEGGQGQGWMTYTHHPRFGSNYRGLTNRCDLLLETYSYLSFPERVRTTYEFVRETLGYVAETGPQLMDVVARSQRPPERIAVRYRLTASAEPAEILTREPRTLGGAPVTVTIPHLASFAGTEIVDRPWAYAVPAHVAQRLAGHGLAVRALDQDVQAELEVARVTGWAEHDARRILEVSLGEREMLCTIERTTRKLSAGTWIVETEQPLGAVAVYLCEPRSDDGVAACGWIAAPAVGDEFPIARIVAPLAPAR